jgi:peptidoglycan/xylan/chitin deacetylase (PgdA/CDA1 family)
MRLVFFFLFALSVSTVTQASCELRSHAALAREVMAEMKRLKLSCNPHKVHLTFDDGPSSSYTPLIIKELGIRKVKASFFITTTNLEARHPRFRENKAIIQGILKEGHLLANHGHDHAAHDLRMNGEGKVLERGFTQAEREAQLKKSIDLLNQSSEGKFSQQALQLFRFPYGRGAMPSQKELQEMMRSGQIKLSSQSYASQLKEYRSQSPALQTLAGSGFSHLGWNHDSQDSSYGAGVQKDETVKKFIINNLKSLCASKASSQVALFHDIKAMNAIAIPVIIDIGQCMGLDFISPSEMVKNKDSLISSGVLIPKENIEIAPFRNMEELLSSLNLNGVKPDCEEEKLEKSCYSQQYQRSYPHCSGGESICFEGKWYSKNDPMVRGCLNE